MTEKNMRVDIGKYAHLHDRISNIILELMNIQTEIENLYIAEGPDNSYPGVAVGEDKHKSQSKANRSSVFEEFSVAMVSDGIDSDTVSKFEDILKRKKDELKG